MAGSRAVRVAVCGLGPIGGAIARLVASVPGLALVGASDPAPHLHGKDLGVALGLDRKLRVKVAADAEDFLAGIDADLAILSTTSSLAEQRPLLQAALKRGLFVVSTCEELALPLGDRAAMGRDVDALARKKKVAVIATGVNPGFAMDALPLALTAACSEVTRISVTRVVDAGTRRLPLQRKIGAGMALPQFRRAVTEGSVRHVGLLESLHLLASGLGWKLDEAREFPPEPVIAPRDLQTEHLRVPAGSAAGIRQVARGWRAKEAVITLDLQMYVGAENARDHIVIEGRPPLDVTIRGGIAGDEATVALAVNVIPHLLDAEPGLRVLRDLPLVHHLNREALRRA